jgi:hypothetical protein
VREAGLFLRVVFLRVVVLGLDLLLLLNDRLDLPTAGWWRGTFSETGFRSCSSAKRCQTCAICSALTRASAFERVHAIARHCCARRRYSSAFLCVTPSPVGHMSYQSNDGVRRSESHAQKSNQHNGFGVALSSGILTGFSPCGRFWVTADGCKNITVIFFRARILADEAQAQ